MANEAQNPGRRRGIGWRISGSGSAVFLLLLPLVANAPWTARDFIFLGLLLGAIGFSLELAVRKGNAAYTLAAGVALAAAFLLVWINGAVGIIGNEQEDVNLLFGGVLAAGLLGAIVARFRPVGMALAMAAAALIQVLVPVAASALGPSSTASIWSAEVLLLTGFFAAMWLTSALLFHKAVAPDLGPRRSLG